ncbi:MAG: hypothetical protein U5L45_22405 [Saprospiraceae bacterium]|nr:hypothetical protein [Saprospiraceae bacterium]
MKGIDLQNGVFEEEGLKYARRYGEKKALLSCSVQASNKNSFLKNDTLNLSKPAQKSRMRGKGQNNQYDAFFD